MKYGVFLLMMSTTVFCYGKNILSKRSIYNNADTVKKVEEIIKGKNFEVVVKIDHAKSATLNRLYLQPAVLILFGNAQLTHSIMLDNPVWTMYFPLHVSVYDDHKGKTWISVIDLLKVEKEHSLHKEQKEKIQILALMLDQILNIKQ